MLNNSDKKNAVWNSLTFVVISVIGFISFSINVKSFQFELFGLYILISSIFIIGNNFDFGFGMSTVKHISESKKLRDYETINKIYVSYFFIYLILSLVILIIFLIYYCFFLAKSVALQNNYDLNVNLLFAVLCFSFIVRYIGNYFKNILEGFMEFVILNKILILTTILNLIFVIIVFILKLNLIYLATAGLIVNVAFILSLITVIRIYLKDLNFCLRYFSLELIKNHIAYGLNIQLSFFVASFVEPVIKYLLGNILSLNYVTYYEIGKKIIDLTNGIIASAQKGLFNRLSEENAVNNLVGFMNNKLYYYSKISNYYTIIIYGVLNSVLSFFTYYWFKSYESMLILQIFMLPYSLINFAGCAHMVIMLEGKGFVLLILQFINLIVITFLLYISLYYFQNYFGLIGFYLATLINVSLILLYLKYYKSFALEKYLKDIVIKDIILLNIIILVFLVLFSYYDNYYIYLIILTAIIYPLIFYKYIKGLNSKIKEKYSMYFIKTIFKGNDK